MSFVDTFHRNDGAKMDLAVETTLLFLDYFTLGLRLWSRRLRRTGLQGSDWLIIAATTVMTARYSISLCLIFQGGLGMHIGEAFAIGGTGVLTTFLKLVYAVDLMWITTCTLTKLAVLFFYIEVFYIKNKFIRLCYVAVAVSIAYGIASFFHFAFYCTPVKKSWYPTMPGHCGDDNVKYLMWGSVDIVLDAIIICLPVPILSSLQLPIGKKLGLVFVFGLGLSILAIMGVRFKFYKEMDLTDATYSLSSMALFAALVPLLGIINANIPAIPPALQHIFKSNAFATQKGVGSSTGVSSLAPQPWSNKKGVSGRFESEFERLSDPDIPLVNVQGGTQGNRDSNGGNSKIQVTTNWRVQSSPRKF